jgi:hypothetical protein
VEQLFRVVADTEMKMTRLEEVGELVVGSVQLTFARQAAKEEGRAMVLGVGRMIHACSRLSYIVRWLTGRSIGFGQDTRGIKPQLQHRALLY